MLYFRANQSENVDHPKIKYKEYPMNQEKINLSIELPLTGFDDLALRRLGGLVAAHAGLSFVKTKKDTLLFDLGERAPTEAQNGAAFVAALCEQARSDGDAPLVP
jgi:hypothetical protein